MITKLQFSVILCTLFASSSAFFNEWSSWSVCSKSCDGEQQRTRTCLTVTLQPCEGKRQTRMCNSSGCYPSFQVIVICAVLGALTLLLLVVLVIILIQRRRSTRHNLNELNHAGMVPVNSSNFSNDNICRNNEIQGDKCNVQRTLSNKSVVSQLTYLEHSDANAISGARQKTPN